MKVKTRYAVSFICIAIFVGIGMNFFLESPILTEKRALIILFGNYDEMQKHAIWKHMAFSKKEASGYFAKKTGIVSAVFLKSYQESGKRKFFLLTKTTPIDVPFECHACLPLWSATIFSKIKGDWQIEAQNLFLMYEGEYGASPVVKLVSIGDDKYGVMVEYEHENGEFSAKELTLLVPYRKRIEKAHQETTYYNNFNGCGWSLQCATFYAKIDFEKSKKANLYWLHITRFGTKDDADQNYKAVPVDDESVYQLRNGKYVQISWKGYPKMHYD